jgi:hypothetical protein
MPHRARDTRYLSADEADIQGYTNFGGAAGTAAKQAEGGKAFVKFLASADAAQVMKAKGLEPVN